jgi:hypothetical protein
MTCPYCQTQVSVDGACACQTQAAKVKSPAPEIRAVGADRHEAAVRVERLPFHGLELPIP